jgi:4-alpha-glucanotransferase
MKFDRSSGILLHPTSLPGQYGIGDLGPTAHKWVDFLAEVGCGLWQVLPLGPTGYGDSPYQCFSAFAGNPYLISPEILLEQGLLLAEDLTDQPDFPEGEVVFGEVIPWKLELLEKAYKRYKQSSGKEIQIAFEDFQDLEHYWLPDFSLFMALKEAYGGGSWVDWPEPLRNRDTKSLQLAYQEYEEEIDRQMFMQFLFFRQWAALHEHALDQNIHTIGDIPIFVAHDSAEVWAKPDLFYLDEDGNPTVVAGVPPDYFSKTGQLWGNPLYRWRIHARNNFDWWIKRMRAVLHLVDIVRLDHFRGFAGYWEVPASEETAENGRWVPGPGKSFFQAVKDALGDLPIIAEDLGVITPDVVEMREHFNLPGMRVLLFAFTGDPDEAFLPHNHVKNCVVYTGTHDNDTSRGWYKRVGEDERAFYRRYLGRSGQDVAWDLIRAAWSSIAVFAVAPFQDFLDLDNQARMNYPGNPSGNWSWRMNSDALSKSLSERIKDFNFLFSRSTLPKVQADLHDSEAELN